MYIVTIYTEAFDNFFLFMMNYDFQQISFALSGGGYFFYEITGLGESFLGRRI